ncbi:MAG TPA: AtpZ/AtpI family protein [Candidatus Acidoferrum sp.]|nr:AtpZ/AtpI family protein [Candidatus Acidoferrum sp.]
MLSDNDDKTTPGTSPPLKQARSFSRQFAMAMELPFVLVGAIIAGGAMGYFLDVWLHTKPVLMFVFGCIGFAAGVRDVLRRLPKE